MATQVGKGHIYGLTGAAIGIASLAGYVSPNLQSLRIAHNTGDHKEIKDQSGEVSGKIFVPDDIIELTIDFIPEGATLAAAKLSAGLPSAGAVVTITGLAVIAIGSFADALNASSTNPWFYEGGGSINGVNDDKWSMTLPLRRYKGITSGTAITS
jgi:hypothetical protein